MQLLATHCEQGSAFIKSWFTQLCDEFFSSFFYERDWKGDRKILLAVLYAVFMSVVWKRFI